MKQIYSPVRKGTGIATANFGIHEKCAEDDYLFNSL